MQPSSGETQSTEPARLRLPRGAPCSFEGHRREPGTGTVGEREDPHKREHRFKIPKEIKGSAVSPHRAAPRYLFAASDAAVPRSAPLPWDTRGCSTASTDPLLAVTLLFVTWRKLRQQGIAALPKLVNARSFAVNKPTQQKTAVTEVFPSYAERKKVNARGQQKQSGGVGKGVLRAGRSARDQVPPRSSAGRQRSREPLGGTQLRCEPPRSAPHRSTPPSVKVADREP